MSPEARTSAAELLRLQRELVHDRAALGRHERDVAELLAAWQDDRRSLALAAVTLHAWYTGLESLLERILRTLDADLPSGPTGHRDVLLQSVGELPGVRPAVLPPVLLDELLALLKFRHFFRHAYAVELDPARLRSQTERLRRLAPEVAHALADFEAFVSATLTQLAAR